MLRASGTEEKQVKPRSAGRERGGGGGEAAEREREEGERDTSYRSEISRASRKYSGSKS